MVPKCIGYGGKVCGGFSFFRGQSPRYGLTAGKVGLVNLTKRWNEDVLLDLDPTYDCLTPTFGMTARCVAVCALSDTSIRPTGLHGFGGFVGKAHATTAIAART